MYCRYKIFLINLRIKFRQNRLFLAYIASSSGLFQQILKLKQATIVSNELLRYLSTVKVEKFDITEAYMTVDLPRNQPRDQDRRVLRREFESQIIGQEAGILNQLFELRRLNLRDIRSQYTFPVHQDALSTESSETKKRRRVETFERFGDTVYEVTVPINKTSEEEGSVSSENTNSATFVAISTP